MQLLRAVFAALAAVMITFSPDHSASVGLAVFSGFAIATGLVLVVSAWFAHPSGERWPSVALGVVALIAGMFAGVPGWRTTIAFFVIVVLWALLSGALELIAGIWLRRRGRRTPGRDALTTAILTLVLGVALLFVSPQYALDYTIAEANRTFTLTGITIGVGVFGGYAAIVAVYLGIGAFSPSRDALAAPASPSGRAS